MSKIYYSHILAASENNVIGVANDLPWSLPKDMEYFKNTTRDHILIMGRKTFDSFQGRLLPKREHIVITRDPESYLKEFKEKYKDSFKSEKFQTQFNENVFFVTDLDLAFNLSKELHKKRLRPDEVFIIGGGEIYKQSLKDVKKIYLTRIHKIYRGDTLYPELPTDQFKIISERPEQEGDVKYTYYIYERT